MEESNNQSERKKINRRSFMKGALAFGAAIGIGVKLGPESFAQQDITNATPLPSQSESPINTPEVVQEQNFFTYNDLTPGIGIGVAWVGHGSTWNTIVENIIKAIKEVNIEPYVFVPKHQESNFDAFILEQGFTDGVFHKILCDPEFEESNDAAEIGSGKNKVTTKKGFRSSWIRDFGTLVANDGTDKISLAIRKNGVSDPLSGTDLEIKTKEVGLKFDGGSFFHFSKRDGSSVFLASENELVNNNSYYIKQEKGRDIDVKQEVTSRIQKNFGVNTDVVYLPRLIDNGVDHIDTFVMPLGDDIIVVGESLKEDKNYEILNNTAKLLAEKGFQVHRVPIRRVGEQNTVTYTNILPHITEDRQKYIFMPTYEGFQAENDIAKTIYSNLGFTVVPIDSTSTIDKGGSIHCATNTSITAPFINSL